jgi:thymidylate kinase
VIIHINGWPGVGKLTVARELARRLDARLLDNHTLHDIAIRLCDRGTEEYWDLYYQVREVAYQRIRVMPLEQVLVMTNPLLSESHREVEAWDAVKQLAADRKDSLVSVTLDCSLDENIRRISSEERRHRKMVDPAPLIEWRSKYTLLADESVPSLTIDTDTRGAAEVAEGIERWLGEGAAAAGWKR